MTTEGPKMPPAASSRRRFLKQAAATTATLALTEAIRAAFPGGIHIAEAAGPEVKGAKLGFIALTDAAPLFVAKEKGIFAKYGLPDVEVLKQASWGTTRDNLVLGSEGKRHRRGPHPHADALPDLGRQGDAEQRADADVDSGAARSELSGHLGRQRIRRSEARP